MLQDERADAMYEKIHNAGTSGQGVTPALSQLQALDDVLAIAEFDGNGCVRQVNENLLNLFGYQSEEVVGRHHSEFCLPDFADHPRYLVLWQDLMRGISGSGLIIALHKTGRFIWIDVTWVPVADMSGQITGVLALVRPANEQTRHDFEQPALMYQQFQVTEVIHTAVMVSDGTGHIRYVSKGFTQLLGWELNGLNGVSSVDLLLSELDEPARQAVIRELSSGEPLEGEYLIEDKSHHQHWVRLVCYPIVNPQTRQVLHQVWMVYSVTHSKIYEALQQQVLEALVQERPLVDVLELICNEVERIAPDITATILELDNQGRLFPLAGPGMAKSYSRQLEGLQIGPNVGSCGSAAWFNQPVLVTDIATDPRWDAFRDYILPLGYIGCWSTPVCNNQGKVIGTFAFYFRQPLTERISLLHQYLIDVSTHLCSLALTREHARQRISQLAFYDSLTGLPNRSLLQAKLDQEIEAAAHRNEAVAVLFIDLDRFKQINDSYSHQLGDDVLVQVAQRLQCALRVTDIAGRLSGDEFLVVMPQCDKDQAQEAVSRLQSVLHEPLELPGTALSVTATIGLAMYPNDGKTVDELIQHADLAMSQAKSCGRGQWAFFSNDMGQTAQERMKLESALRRAVKQSELQLYYQPQITLRDNSIYGVEALARWIHPEFGMVPPSRFIPLAQECGLIAELGIWAMDTACEQLAAWQAQGIPVPAVSVNLSSTSFHDLSLPVTVAKILEKHGLEPHHLTLELTESVLLDSNVNTVTCLNEVNALGVRLSMDDFGTGYSSLSYLRRLPFSELKLDRSFVADLENDEIACSLSKAIMGIGESLRLIVVAEGVETSEQFNRLRDQGYPVVQGYLLARPMTPQALLAWLDERQMIASIQGN